MLRLKELRAKKGLKQSEAAEILGIATSTYSKYERGESQPDFRTLSKIADFFEVSVDFLLNRETKVKELSHIETGGMLNVSNDELVLVVNYRQLSDYDQHDVDEFVKHKLKNSVEFSEDFLPRTADEFVKMDF